MNLEVVRAELEAEAERTYAAGLQLSQFRRTVNAVLDRLAELPPRAPQKYRLVKKRAQ